MLISEGAEKEKMDRKHIFKSNDLISVQQWRNRPMGKVGGEKGKGEMDGESNRNLQYHVQSRVNGNFAEWLRELKQGLCDRLKGGEVREGGDMGVPMADSC